jgi:hypothetical protein
MARKKQSKLGRPPKHEGERLSKNRTFRVRGTLDEQLEAAARDAKRSVSEEIERRLEESFRREERAELILEAINRTLKVLGISTDPGTWSPEMHAWAAQQPGLLGLSRYLPKAQGASEQPPEDTSEQPATDKKEDSK